MSNCNNCAEHNEEKKMPETVSYVVYEAMLDREMRHTRKWMIAFFVTLGMLFSLIVGVLIYESQFETYYYDQDSNGVNIIGDDNEVKNNEPKVEDQTEAQQQG